MPQAIIYCRVSSDRQVRDGHGLEGQEARCRRYAEERGYAIAAVYRDEGVSGGIIDREGMQQVLGLLDQKQDSGEWVVIIDDIKRLARDLIGHFTLRKSIQTRGARLESPSHKFGNEPEEVFVESIMAATAELERNQNKKQVLNRMKARLEAGYWTFYPPPGYVYAKVPGHGKLLVPHEPEAGIVREALEGYASGRFPNQIDVQHFLRSKGFTHWGRGPGTYLEQVKRILTREVYTGFLSYPPWNVTTRKAHHQPLISPETFDCIQERLRERAKMPHRKDLNRDFPLRGFVLCAACGKPLTAAWSRGKNRLFAYYRCKTKGCDRCHKSLRADRMHTEFEALLAKLKPRPSILTAMRDELLTLWNDKKLSLDQVRRGRKRKLEEVQRQIDGFVKAVGQCSNPTIIRRIEEEVAALEAKKLRLGGPIEGTKSYDFEHALGLGIEFLKSPLLMWRSGDLDQRRLVLRLVFAAPLRYDEKSQFGTPSFSLPINVACVLELDRMELVDQIRNSLNTFFDHIQEWAALLGARDNGSDGPTLPATAV